MSRNLGDTYCAFCGGRPTLVEEPRPVTEQDVFKHYYPEYAGMLVAHAECPDCGGKYLAWCHPPDRWGTGILQRIDPDVGFFDLSFRASFNDEPAPSDLYTIHPNVARARRLRWEADKLEADTSTPHWENYRR